MHRPNSNTRFSRALAERSTDHSQLPRERQPSRVVWISCRSLPDCEKVRVQES